MATIAGYGLAEPTAAELETSLRTLLGDAKASHLIASTLDAIGEPGTSLEGLRRSSLWAFCTHAERHKGLIAVIIRSFSIRLRTYEGLTAPEAPESCVVRGAAHE